MKSINMLGVLQLQTRDAPPGVLLFTHTNYIVLAFHDAKGISDTLTGLLNFTYMFTLMVGYTWTTYLGVNIYQILLTFWGLHEVQDIDLVYLGEGEIQLLYCSF